MKFFRRQKKITFFGLLVLLFGSFFISSPVASSFFGRSSLKKAPIHYKSYIPTVFWELEDNAESTVVLDSSGNGNNGTLNGVNSSARHTTTAKIGSGFDYAGTSDTSRIDSTVQLTDNFLFAAWVRADTSPDGQFLAGQPVESTWADGWALHFFDGKIKFFTHDYPFHQAYSTFTPKTSFQLICAYFNSSLSSSNLRIWVDTIEGTAANDAGAGPVGGSEYFQVGGDGDGTGAFLKYIDEVRYYNSVSSSDAEALCSSIYNSGSGRNTAKVAQVDTQTRRSYIPQLFLKLDDSSTRVLDYSGNDRHGILSEGNLGALYTTGKLGGGFSGISSSQKLYNFSGYKATGNKIYVSVWIKPSGAGGTSREIVSQDQTEIYINGDNKAAFYFLGAYPGGSVPHNDAWHHVVWSYDGSAGSSHLKTWVDNSLTVAGERTGDLPSSTNTLTVANYPSGNFAWGQGIDEVRIYNDVPDADVSALTSALYNSGDGTKDVVVSANGNSYRPQLFVRAEEKKDASGSSGVSVADYSGHNRIGTLSSGTTSSLTTTGKYKWGFTGLGSTQIATNFDGYIATGGKFFAAAWLKTPASAVTRDVIGQSTANPWGSIWVWSHTDGKIYYYLNDANINATLPFDSSWHLLCLSYDSSASSDHLKIWLDTSAGTAASELSDITTPDDYLHIGYNGGYSSWGSGAGEVIDGVRVYNDVPDSDAAALCSLIYNGGSGTDERILMVP